MDGIKKWRRRPRKGRFGGRHEDYDVRVAKKRGGILAVWDIVMGVLLKKGDFEEKWTFIP